MKKITKVSITLVLLLVTVVLTALIAVVTLDPNDHKEWVAEQFRQRTGRAVSLEGDIGLTLYPWFGLSLSQVSIANANGFDEPTMFKAELAEVRVKLLPMLRKHYEVDTVKLFGASLNLSIDETGASNWADLMASPQAQSASSGEADNSLILTNFVLGGVDVQDASFRFEDFRSGAHYEISNLAFKTDALVYGVPIDLNISLDAMSLQPEIDAGLIVKGTVFYDIDNGRYQLEPLSLQANLRGNNIPGGQTDLQLTTSLSLDLDDDSLLLSDLDLNVLGTRLLATINGRGVTTRNPVYQSDITLTGDDLALLFQVAEIEPLASQLSEIDDRTFQIESSASFDMGQNGIEVSRLDANLLGASLSGTLRASDIDSENPVVQGDINASGPDLPLVIEVLGQISGGRDSLLSEAGREMRQVTDKAFSLDTRFNANLQSDEVIVSTLDARLLGASVSGNLSASNVRSDSPLVKGSLNAEGPDLPLMLQIAGWFQGGVESNLFQYGERLNSVGNKAFAANAEFDADLQNGNIEIPALTASAMGLQLDGNISTRNMDASNGSVNGALRLSGNNLNEVVTAIGQPGVGDVLQGLSMDIQLSGNRSNLLISPLQFDIIVAGERIPNSPVTLSMNAATRVNMDRETLAMESFALSGLGLDASGQVNVSEIFGTPVFEGQLQLASFNPRRFLQQLNQTVPDTADNTVLQQLALVTQFSGSTSNVEFRELNVALDDSRITGQIAIENFEEPATAFELQIDQLDLDRYLAPDSGSAQASGGAPTAPQEIPVEQLRRLQVEGQLQMGNLSVAGMTLSDLSLGLSAAGGQISLAPLSTSLYQGSLDGNASLSVTSEIPIIQVDADLRQVDMETLLQDLMDATYVSGRGNLQIAVTATGANTTTLRSNLNGNGRIDLVDGVFTGVDVASVLGQVETMLRSRQAAGLQRGEQTAFDSFQSALNINDSVISTNDLLIKSPGFQVAGSGILLDLNNNAIDFNMVTSVDRATATRDTQEYNIGGYTLPIACTGNLEAPRCLPDAGEIVRGALAREVQQRVGGLIERAIGIETPQPTAPTTGGVQNVEPEPQPEPQPEPEPTDIRDELINRALDRIFN